MVKKLENVDIYISEEKLQKRIAELGKEISKEFGDEEIMVISVLNDIADEIEDRFGVRRLAIVHRIGEVGPGEPSVVIAAAAPHRAEAFEACRYAIEELKARAPIWKAERFADGRVWMGTPPRRGPVDASGD